MLCSVFWTAGVAAPAGVCQRGGGAGHLQPGVGAAEGMPGLVPRDQTTLWGVSGGTGGCRSGTPGPVSLTHQRWPQHLCGETCGRATSLHVNFRHHHTRIPIVYVWLMTFFFLEWG